MSAEEPGDAVQQARDWLRQQTGREPLEGAGSRSVEGPPAVESRCLPSSTRLDSAPGPVSDSSSDPDADSEAVARAILVRKLAAQDRTRHELATALDARNVPAEVAEQLLDRFEDVGLIDDRAFARRWVDSRQGRRHRSRLALRRELAGKGVDRAVVDEALSQVGSEDELAAARAYGAKVAQQMSGLDPIVRRRRLADRLARRGFGADVIGRVLKDLAAE